MLRPSRRRRVRAGLAGLTVLGVLVGGAHALDGGTPVTDRDAAATASSTTASSTTGAAATAQERREELDTRRRVLVVSVDGLRSSVLTEIAEDLPTFARLRAEGAGTLEARTVVQQTETLPDHTSMVTGRRIDASRGGHGVTWNADEPGRTVQQAAGGPVESLFSRVHAAGGTTALFTGKSKFSLFDRSWPDGLDRHTLESRGARLVRQARRDLRRETRTVTFLHISAPDLAGHAEGWGSPAYLDAVRAVDGWLADVLRTVASKPVLRKRLTILLTSDHGGSGSGHADPRVAAHYRVPFLTWGAGVDAGDLYDLNPERRDPRAARPGYAKRRQPVRNADVANLALDLLGLRAVPGSGIGADQDLDLR